ncbi:hypothetical protein ACTWLT_07440 [Micromonospora sp. ZYX-F-536]|uniref:hypothetical protein n=1 Tax=Micromonospora sp. ZYX-F-536 TaxID=3457629 RepID=UPI0040407B9E
MQEQPPSEPTRREPADRARRRPPRATFTPPIPEQSAEITEQSVEEAASGAAVTPVTPNGQRARRAKAAPAVLFQPPDPDLPLPRQPVRPPMAGSGRSEVDQPDVPAAGTERPDAPAAGVEQPGSAEPTGPVSSAAAPANGPAPEAGSEQPANRTPKTRASRTTPARKAVARKAAGASAEASATTAPPADAAPTAPTATPTKRTAASAATPTKRTASPTKRAASARKTAPKKAVPAPAPETPPEQTSTAVVPQTPAQPAEQPAVPDRRDTAPALARTPESELRAVTARLLDHPGFAPELLALAAVRSLGPGAADWAERLRARYPDAPADGLARLATRRFVRSAGAGGGAAALAGLFAPVAELASVLWTHANLVLHLAAAYGRDPAHPDRAAELLVLTQVHPDVASARDALAAAQVADDPADGTWARAAEAAWRLAAPLTAQAGGWLALRLASRLLPGAAVLAAALGDAAAADRLAARAVAVYRRSPAEPAAG